jgi:hypothetical protein
MRIDRGIEWKNPPPAPSPGVWNEVHVEEIASD